MTSLLTELGVILALTLLNGVFSGAEIAMLSVRKTRLRELAGAGDRRARAALALRRDPDRLLATVQIGVTVVGATTAVFGGASIARPIERAVTGLGAGRLAGELALAAVVALVSYLSLVLGELVPKSLALRAPERFALGVARGLSALSWALRPVVWVLTASSNLVLRPFRDRTHFSESRLSPDELQALLEESASAGVLHPVAGDLASRAVDLGRVRANALMVPRPRIVSLEASSDAAAIRAVLRASPHARYPVHDGHEEQLLGYVLAREVLERLADGQEPSLRTLLRPIPYFPETAPAIEVMRALQASRQQLGVLVDEHGALAGLLTIEDVVEDLFGEIVEEHETVRVLVHREPGEGAVLAAGEAPLHEVERELGQALPEAPGASTLAGLLLRRVGRVPVPGERIALGDAVDAEVVDADDRQVRRVRLVLRARDRTSTGG
jgi:putative hemolysin